MCVINSLMGCPKYIINHQQRCGNVENLLRITERTSTNHNKRWRRQKNCRNWREKAQENAQWISMTTTERRADEGRKADRGAGGERLKQIMVTPPHSRHSWKLLRSVQLECSARLEWLVWSGWVWRSCGYISALKICTVTHPLSDICLASTDPHTWIYLAALLHTISYYRVLYMQITCRAAVWL